MHGGRLPDLEETAKCALMWKNAKETSITTTGTAAMMVDSNGLPKGS
jgi:hypothetical protein